MFDDQYLSANPGQPERDTDNLGLAPERVPQPPRQPAPQQPRPQQVPQQPPPQRPYTQADDLQVQKLNQALSAADEAYYDQEIDETGHYLHTQKIHAQLQPLLARQKQHKQEQQQQQKAQAMDAVAQQEAIAGLHAKLQAQEFGQTVSTYTDPETGETVHFFQKERGKWERLQLPAQEHWLANGKPAAQPAPVGKSRGIPDKAFDNVPATGEVRGMTMAPRPEAAPEGSPATGAPGSAKIDLGRQLEEEKFQQQAARYRNFQKALDQSMEGTASDWGRRLRDQPPGDLSGLEPDELVSLFKYARSHEEKDLEKQIKKTPLWSQVRRNLEAGRPANAPEQIGAPASDEGEPLPPPSPANPEQPPQPEQPRVIQTPEGPAVGAGDFATIMKGGPAAPEKNVGGVNPDTFEQTFRSGGLTRRYVGGKLVEGPAEGLTSQELQEQQAGADKNIAKLPLAEYRRRAERAIQKPQWNPGVDPALYQHALGEWEKHVQDMVHQQISHRMNYDSNINHLERSKQAQEHNKELQSQYHTLSEKSAHTNRLALMQQGLADKKDLAVHNSLLRLQEREKEHHVRRESIFNQVLKEYADLEKNAELTGKKPAWYGDLKARHAAEEAEYHRRLGVLGVPAAAAVPQQQSPEEQMKAYQAARKQLQGVQ